MRLVIKEIILPEALERVRRLARNPDPMLKAIGAYLVAKAGDAFEQRGRPQGSWQPRAVPNIAGVIRDFHDGLSEPKPERFRGEPLLQDTGDLKRSIASKVEGNAIVVGSNLDYAPKHQFGEDGVPTDVITEEFQRWLEEWMMKQERRIRSQFGSEAGDLVRQNLTQDLGWLSSPFLTGEPLEIDIPARPFLDVLPEDERNIQEIALDFVEGRVPENG